MINPEFQHFAEVELTLQQEKYRTRSERYRAAAAETHARWRLQWTPRNGQPLPVDWSAVPHLLGAGLGDIARLELTKAFLPMLHTLGRIERDIEQIALYSKNSDPFKPSRSVG